MMFAFYKNTKHMASQEAQLHLAKDYRHFVYEGLSFASERGNELAHEFMRLEVQVAAVLFAFSGVFIGVFAGDPNVWVRLTFAAVLLFLVASMVAGLFHIKIKEQSWNHTAKERDLEFRRWQDTIGRNGSFDEARAYEAGISRAFAEMTSPPIWSWILQSAFLGIATILLFVLVAVFLFR